MKKQLYVGKGEPTEQNIGVITNSVEINKPLGGFWTSTFIDEQVGSEWVTFSKNVLTKYNGSTKAFTLTPKKDARIAHVDSMDDYEELLRKYRLEMVDPRLASISFFSNLIDYELLSKDYDGFHISQRAISIAKYTFDYISLGAFDCESTVWFRWCFDDVEELDKKYY
ncbi:hypothetical protein bcgnr5378_04760 [Bacillus cereus]|uniref:Uncharacterized protein n=1 Tax=Bacillus cereus TaxID=1396 RepID=A0A164LES3_BACCE|nr:hypothetical protein [Bacillus cereus]KZD55739.1 hypothetical protein B4088_5484 [Bacillus cereus]